MSSIKQRTHHLLHKNKWFIQFIYGLIILNIVALILESYKNYRNEYTDFFYFFEAFSVLIFTIEYILRFWVADLNKKRKTSKSKSRFSFAFSTMGIIDLMAILPFYLPMFFAIDLRVLRILRLFRLARLFKLGRFSRSLKTINKVLKDTRSDLTITAFIAFILLVLSSTLMYYAEGDEQPEKFASIGHAFWWAVATLTTVGYGDVFPVTSLGKFLSGVIAMIGIGFVALPTGIISSAFVDKIREQKQNKTKCKCPNCNTVFELKHN